MRRSSIAIAVGLLLSVVLSQTALGVDLGLGGNSLTHIRAEKMALESSSRSVLFSGHVRIKGSTYSMASDTLRIYYGEEFHDVRSAVANGNVRIDSGNRRATGEKAILNPASHTIELTGSPTVLDNGHQLRGRKIIIHLDNHEYMDPSDPNIAPDDPLVASR